MNDLVLVANPGDNTITAFRLETAALELLATNPVPSCGTFAVDADRNLVYAASKQGPALITYALDRGNGQLTEVHRRPVEAPLAYVALSPDGTRLLQSSYHAGFGTAHPVDAEGVVGDAVGRVEHRNVHSGVVSPDGRHAYFCSLGDDLVAQCALGEDASLTPLDPPTVAMPETSGPRHITLDATGGNAYVVTEFSGEVLHLHRDAATGVLTRADEATIVDPDAGLEHSAYGRDPRKEHLVWGADVHVHGQRLWASERCASTLATLPATPGLGAVESFVRTEEQPRGFAVSPDGRRLVAVGELSGHASLYDVSGTTPELLHRTPTGAGANWVVILPAR